MIWLISYISQESRGNASGLLQVIRQYHGHLSGVYALKLHPTLNILMTGGRDSCCRVWDMRTKVQVHCLTGHDDTVCSILTQSTDPQVCPLSTPCLALELEVAAGKNLPLMATCQQAPLTLVNTCLHYPAICRCVLAQSFACHTQYKGGLPM